MCSYTDKKLEVDAYACSNALYQSLFGPVGPHVLSDDRKSLLFLS